MTIMKRWAVLAALLMAGCGGRVAYAADAVQNVKVASGSVALNGAPDLSTAVVRLNGAPDLSTATVKLNGAPDLSTAVVRLNGAPDLSTATVKLNGAPDLSTATVALRGNVAGSTLTVVAVAGSTSSITTSVSVPATGTTSILPLNAGRFHGEILNNSTTDLWVPFSPAVAGTGWKVGPGATFTWDVTSPLYGVSGTGTIQVFILDVSK